MIHHHRPSPDTMRTMFLRVSSFCKFCSWNCKIFHFFQEAEQSFEILMPRFINEIKKKIYICKEVVQLIPYTSEESDKDRAAEDDSWAAQVPKLFKQEEGNKWKNRVGLSLSKIYLPEKQRDVQRGWKEVHSALVTRERKYQIFWEPWHWQRGDLVGSTSKSHWCCNGSQKTLLCVTSVAVHVLAHKLKLYICFIPRRRSHSKAAKSKHMNILLIPVKQ